MTEVETIPAWGKDPSPVRGGPPNVREGVLLRKVPYSPVTGRPLAALGRDDELQEWGLARRRVESSLPARSVVVYGLQGVGRTTLLEAFHRRAEDSDWVVVVLEATAGSSLRDTLARALYPVVRDFARSGSGEKLTQAVGTFKSFSTKVDIASTWSIGFDIASELGLGDSGELGADIRELVSDLADAAKEQSRGFAILINEAQDLTRQALQVLCAICHQGESLGWPFLLALRGSPSLPGALSKATSSDGHLFSQREIAQLPPGAARQALTRPAAGESVWWDQEAVS